MPEVQTFAELYGAVFPEENQTLDGVLYGPTGADFEGTLEQNGISGPPPAGQLLGLMTCLDESGQPEAGVEIHVQMIAPPEDLTANAFDSRVWTQISDANGAVAFNGLVQGAMYRVWRGCETWKAADFEVPDTGTTMGLADVIGS